MENEKNLEAVQEETIPAEETASVEEPVSAEETVPAENAAAEEAASAEDAVTEEIAPAEEVASEEPKPEEKKVTPAKMALLIGAIVVVAAIIVALLAGGMKGKTPAVEDEATLDTAVEETQPEPTIPADGNPDDETCKGTYTVTDAEVIAAADTVVATVGEHKLTNAQLQVFYWMQIQNFLSSEYGNYMMYYGMLDIAQPLDTQSSLLAENRTWQQFFLREALITWRNYCALSDKAKAAQLPLTEEEKNYLDTLEESMTSAAQYYGLETVEDLLYRLVGAGAGMEEYRHFQELLSYGNLYYDQEYAKLAPTEEEMETYFAEREEELAANGITKDAYLVDVRHVLFTPDGGTTDESGATTYSDEAWAACEAEAQEVLNTWAEGDRSEESFAALAATYSEDPGSQNNGGLYEGVQQGQMVPEFDSWCFDASRKTGDYGMVKTTYGYHLMYFVDQSLIWKDYVHQNLMAEKANQLMETVVADFPLEVDYSAISLGYVDMQA